MDFQGKRVLVVGLARSGMAAIKVLHTLGATIILSESKKKEDIKELVDDGSLSVVGGRINFIR